MDEEITVEQARKMLQLGDKAPDFKAVTTHGPISLSYYNGQWVIPFPHPADFTPVCTTTCTTTRSPETIKRGL